MKNRLNKMLAVIPVLIFLAAPAAAQQQNRAELIRFADFLFQSHDFSRAAYEYLRVLHLCDNTPVERDDLNFRIGNCFGFLNQTENARKYYGYCLSSRQDEGVYRKALINLGFLLFRSGRYDDSISLLDQNKWTEGDEIVNTIILANELCRSNIGEAGTIFSEFKSQGRSYLSVFDKYLELGSRLKFKSPLKAALMSAVLPGSGRIYAGRLKEGLLSMVGFFSTAYLAYEGFRDHGVKSFKGWLFASISTFLYIGNIHGSALAVRIANRQQEDGFRKGIEVSLRVLIHGK